MKQVPERTRRIQPVPREDVTDPTLIAILERADRLGSPPVEWFLTVAHNPEVAIARTIYQDSLYRGGLVPHWIKELCRIQIAQIVGCTFCAAQRSAVATEVSEADIHSCMIPDWEHKDPRANAALQYARALTLDDGSDELVYPMLEALFSTAEIIELAHYFTLTAGGTRMVKSFGL